MMPGVRRWLRKPVVILGVAMALAAPQASGQVPALSEVPDNVPSPQREEFRQRRAQLDGQWATLRAAVDSHNQRCRSVPAGSAASAECRQAMSQMQGEIAAYVEAVKEFNRMMAAAGAAPPEVSVSAVLSEADELDLGRRMSAELDRRMTFVTEPRVAAYTQGLLERLARHSTRAGIAYRVRVCVDCAVPACFFACSLPGGTIYINSALIQRLNNEAELAGVLAHEVAHVAARHQSRGLDNHARATVIAVLTGGPIWPFVQSAVVMKFGRDQERQADRMAVEMLYQAGIKPTGLVTFFEGIRRMRPAPGITDSVYGTYFSSHPSEQERIANLSPLLADPRFNETRAIDSAEFRAVRARLAAP